jgi:hypothetical protein
LYRIAGEKIIFFNDFPEIEDKKETAARAPLQQETEETGEIHAP